MRALSLTLSTKYRNLDQYKILKNLDNDLANSLFNFNGHNRYEICKELHIPYETYDMEFDTKDAAIEWIEQNQLGRRNLSSEKKREIIARRLIRNPELSDRAASTSVADHKTAAVVRKELEARGEIPHHTKVRGKDGVEQPRTKTTGSKFNRVNENIDWAKWSWNPFTGCWGPGGTAEKPARCPYCYAKEQSERFPAIWPKGFDPDFHEHRLEAPTNTKIPAAKVNEPGINNVFLGSMTDFFGDYIPKDWIDRVFDKVKKSPQWTYLILTKNPQRVREFLPFPENVWVGTTVDIQARVQPAEDAFQDIDATVKYLSCEPLLEPLTFSRLDLFDWVIIGAQSKTTTQPEFQPQYEWVRSLIDQAHRAGCKVYCKPNLRPILREYP